MEAKNKESISSGYANKSDYLKTAKWEDLYIIGQHWQSDMEFYNLELKFLNDIVGKYYAGLCELENQTQVNKAGEILLQLNNEYSKIVEAIKKHQNDVESIMENAFSHDEGLLRNNHLKLETDFSNFIKSFRDVKKRIFSLAEIVMQSNKLKKYLK